MVAPLVLHKQWWVLVTYFSSGANYYWGIKLWCIIQLNNKQVRLEWTCRLTMVGWKKYFNLAYTGGGISFYEDTGTTAKFFWDSAESLGIGTSSLLVKKLLISLNSYILPRPLQRLKTVAIYHFCWHKAIPYKHSWRFKFSSS